MARVKSTTRTRTQGPPAPRNLHWTATADMSDKRQATDDIGGSQSKRTCSSPAAGGSAVAGSASSPAAPAAGGSAVAGSASSPAAPVADATAAASALNTAAANPASFRVFMQIYVLDVPWNPAGENEAWMHMDLDHTHVRFDMLSGVNLLFQEDHFKIIPYGPKVPVIIQNADMCGFDIAPGYSMRWQYDHMFHYLYDNRKRAFMIVRLPIYRPNPPPFAKSDYPKIDAAMRARFKNIGPPDHTTPCWFPLPQAERQRDYWKTLYEAKKRAHDKMLEDYHSLDDKHSALEKDLQETRAKLALHTVALDKIDKALECSLCLERFSSTGPSVMASCGHVVHTTCKDQHAEAKICAECRAPVAYWQDFTGFTAISQAVTTLEKQVGSCSVIA